MKSSASEPGLMIAVVQDIGCNKRYCNFVKPRSYNDDVDGHADLFKIAQRKC